MKKIVITVFILAGFTAYAQSDSDKYNYPPIEISGNNPGEVSANTLVTTQDELNKVIAEFKKAKQLINQPKNGFTLTSQCRESEYKGTKYYYCTMTTNVMVKVNNHCDAASNDKAPKMKRTVASDELPLPLGFESRIEVARNGKSKTVLSFNTRPDVWDCGSGSE